MSEISLIYFTLTPELITAFIATLVFGLSFILAALRLRSKEKVVFHLLLFTGLGFALSLMLLLDLLQATTLSGSIYHLLIELTQLVTILSFGALTLYFLKKGRNTLISYWVVVLVIVLLWNLFYFNVLGWADLMVAWFAQMGFDVYQIAAPAVIVAGLGWITSLGTSLVTLILAFRKRQPTQYLNKLRYWLVGMTLLTASGLIYFINIISEHHLETIN